MSLLDFCGFFFDSANASCVFWEITVQSSLAWPAMNVMQTPRVVVQSTDRARFVQSMDCPCKAQIMHGSIF